MKFYGFAPPFAPPPEASLALPRGGPPLSFRYDHLNLSTVECRFSLPAPREMCAFGVRSVPTDWTPFAAETEPSRGGTERRSTRPIFAASAFATLAREADQKRPLGFGDTLAEWANQRCVVGPGEGRASGNAVSGPLWELTLAPQGFSQAYDSGTYCHEGMGVLHHATRETSFKAEASSMRRAVVGGRRVVVVAG